ncbi:MAG: hypothetical protein ACOCX5_00490 [Chloroflexota bacterium]
MNWAWLTQPEKPYNWRFLRNVVLKAAGLFILINTAYAVLEPLPWLSQFSLYNSVFPGRTRLPHADNPTEAYNVSLNRVEALFASHVISEGSSDDVFRIAIIGDSSVWGWLLDNDETLDACINRRGWETATGKPVRAYNLGYPITSALKDVMILDYAMQFEPDAVIWFMTLQGMYRDNQLDHPILAENAHRVRQLVDRYDLSLDMSVLPEEASFIEQTLVGQRRELANLLRHQIYGVVWSGTNVDHVNPRFFRAPVNNFPDSEGVPTRGYLTSDNLEENLAFDVLDAGFERVTSAGISMLLVNEPIYRADGLNSDLRYNELYPRWVFDLYRELMQSYAADADWAYADLWDAVPPEAFTDYFPLHYDAEATCNVIDRLQPAIESLIYR